MSRRTEIMRRYAANAREYHRRGCAVLRDQAAQDWAGLATISEMRRNKRLTFWGGAWQYLSNWPQGND